MADDIAYLDYIEAVDLHFALMKTWGETRFGVESRDLIESALARPKHAAVYEKADIVRQAATLCFGLIKNHPWTVEINEPPVFSWMNSYSERVLNSLRPQAN